MDAKEILIEIVGSFETEGNLARGTVRIEVINKAREFLGMEPIAKVTPLPPELIEKVTQYELHPEIVEEVKKGNLRFIHEDPDSYSTAQNFPRCPCLVFEIPGLRERRAATYFYWHGPDKATWAVENIRMHADREYDENGSDDAWSPQSDDHEANVDEFISWLKDELET